MYHKQTDYHNLPSDLIILAWDNPINLIHFILRVFTGISFECKWVASKNGGGGNIIDKLGSWEFPDAILRLGNS